MMNVLIHLLTIVSQVVEGKIRRILIAAGSGKLILISVICFIILDDEVGKLLECSEHGGEFLHVGQHKIDIACPSPQFVVLVNLMIILSIGLGKFRHCLYEVVFLRCFVEQFYERLMVFASDGVA